MKKIVALLLSILMLLGMAAIAEEAQETALVTCFSDIVVQTTANGKTTTNSLDNFEAYLSIDTADGLSLVAQAFDGDDSLLLAIAKIVDDQVQLAVEGVNKTYAVKAEQLASQNTGMMAEQFRAALPDLLNFQLPMITVPSLPKLDLKSLVGLFGTEAADGSMTFSVPSETVGAVLDQLVEMAKNYSQTTPGLSDTIDAIEQMRAAGMSFALEGSVVDAADRQTAQVSVLLANQGQVSEDAVAGLKLVTAKDELTLDVDVYNGDQAVNIGNLEILTDTMANAFSATLDIASIMQFYLGAYQEEGFQKAALRMESALDTSFSVYLSYGNDGENDVMEVGYSDSESNGFTMTTATQPVDEATVAGTIDATFVSADSTVQASAKIEKFIGSVSLGDYTMPGMVVPIEDLENETDSAAMQEALSPLIGYFARAFGNIAA